MARSLTWLGPVHINSSERLASSVNGNPRFRLHLSNGETVQTSSDSSVAYDVENFMRGKTEFLYTVTRAGRMDRAQMCPPPWTWVDPSPEVTNMIALVNEVAEVAEGDSNDREISVLQEALEAALARWPEVTSDR